MRSTGFVVVSVVLHVLAFSAIAMAPQSVHEVAGDTVEITMGEPADHAGVADAPAAVDTQAPPAPAPAPTPAPEVKAPPAPVAKVEVPKTKVAPTPPQQAVEKPVEKVEKKPVVAKVAPAPKKVVAHKAAPVKAQDLKAAVTEEDPQAAPIEEAKSEEKSLEEEPKLIPVKEMSPAGVQAATADEPVAPVKEEKAAPVAAPTPAAAPAPAPVAAAAAAGGTEGGKAAEINGLTAGGELGKGGATPAGAVDVGQLRQMAGNKAPLYPLAARREGRQGNLTMLYRVTREGRVSDLKVENSSGSEDLDAEAMKAIAKFRFVPGQEGWARHPVNFNLKGDTATAPSRLRTKVGEQ